MATKPGETNDVAHSDGECKQLLPKEAEPPPCQNPKRKWRERHQKWISISVLYFTMFLSAVSFTIVISSLWPYLLEVDKDSSTKFLGWVVAAYSLGQLVASPILGAWADWRPIQEPLIISLLITVVFSVFYSYAGAFPQQHHVSGWIILISRALIGFGAGVAAIVRSYVSEATEEKERVGAMAGVTVSQAIGFFIGPALGLFFVPLGTEGWRIESIKFVFNVYTAPGYLGAFLGILNIILIIIFFRERKLQTEQTTSWRKMKEMLRDVWHHSWSSIPRPPWDIVAASVSVVLFFVIMFVFSVFETTGTPLTMDEFAWSKKQAVLYNNIFNAGLAVIVIFSLVLALVITKLFKQSAVYQRIIERLILILAMFFIFLSYVALIPMGNDYPSITPVGVEAENVTAPVPLTGNASELVGCRYSQQHWCTSVPKIYLFQYIISLVLLAIGYAPASVLCLSIYSKILGPFKQGTMMGVLAAAGCLARTLGPVFVSSLYQHTGPQITFASVDGLVVAGILILLVFCYRLVPFRETEKSPEPINN